LPWERRRWAVAAIFTALAMASLDTAIANIALPAIASDLHVSPAEVVWVVNVYQIALVATLLPQLREGLTIYIKGSRVNRLERITAALVPDATAGAGGHH
jgi:MFS family permease